MKKPILLLTGLVFAAFVTAPCAFAAKTSRSKASPIAKYDTNKNGKVDADEFAAVRAEFAAKPQGELAKLDTDHDGKLSDEEIAAFSAGSGRKKKNNASPTETALARYDANKNGRVDPEEFAAVRADFTAKPQGDLAKLDTDHDGKLSDEEIAALSSGSGKRTKSAADRAEKKAKRTAKKKS